MKGVQVIKRLYFPIAFVACIGILAACRTQTLPPASEVAATPTLISSPLPTASRPTTSALPSPASTATTTATPTASASPAPTSTATRAILPTLVPKTPAGGPDAYQLAPWTPNQADELIARMEQAVLERNFGPYEGPNLPYRAVWYAVWDALAHFPDDPRADHWRWKLPYYMAWAGEGDEATWIYTDRMLRVLNGDGLAAEDLPTWFQSGEPTETYLTQHFDLQVSPIEVPARRAGQLIAIGNLDDIDTPGGTCLLAAQDGDRYAIYPLRNGFPDFGFFITMRHPISCFARDVTDDGIAEIIIDQYSGGHVGWTDITVLDIERLPPEVMPFNPQRDRSLAKFNGLIVDYPNTRGRTQLQVGEQLGFCEEYGLTNYQWNGEWFEVASGRVDIPENFYPRGDDALASCLFRIADYARPLSPQDAATIFDQGFAAYSESVENNLEMLEEFRILKGLHYAYAGDLEAARAAFDEIARSPTVTDSVWVQPALDFLSTFDAPADLYRACGTVNILAPYYAQYSAEGSVPQITPCKYDAALRATVANAFSAAPLAQITDELRTAGVSIPAEGWFDFDDDGREERWFGVIQPDEVEPELWIAAETNRGKVVAIPVGQVSMENVVLTHVAGETSGGVTDLGNGQTIELVHHPLTDEPFVIVRRPETREPILDTVDQFRELRQRLINGSAAAPIYAQLLAIGQSSSNCPLQVEDAAGTVIADYDCAAYYYTLALAAELSGRGREAVGYFYTVWSKYPLSSFALMARIRLGA